MLPQTTRSSAPLDTSPVISRPLLQLQADLTMRAERGKPAVLVSCKVRSTAGASRHAGEESSSDVPAATVADDEIELDCRRVDRTNARLRRVHAADPD